MLCLSLVLGAGVYWALQKAQLLLLSQKRLSGRTSGAQYLGYLSSYREFHEQDRSTFLKGMVDLSLPPHFICST